MSSVTPAERVAAEVRAALAREGKPQRFVGEVLGLSQPAVSRRMRGEVAFNVTELDLLAIALGVSVSAFYAIAEAPAS